MFKAYTFPCPNCNEIINDSVDKCRFCHTRIDPAAAHAASELQSRVNQACSDASNTASAAYVMAAFLVLDILPIPLIPFWLAFLLTFFTVIAMLVWWQARFGQLKTHDVDFKRALFSRNVAFVLWLVAMPVWVMGHIFGAVVWTVLMRAAF